MPLVCQKCGSTFPLSIRVDGKNRNLNKRKYCLTCSPFRSFNRKNLTVPQPPPGLKQCGRCGETLPISQFYPRKGRKDRLPCCAYCERKRAFTQVRKFKQMCLDYKGARCSRCGYDRCPGALEFHHTDSTQKELQINQGGLRLSR